MDEALFEDLLGSLKQAAAHARGEAIPGGVVHIPKTLDVAAIRRRTGVSQVRFAAGIGVAVATLRNWEQGRRRPEGPARVLLALLDKNPHVVQELLGEAA